jgi:hypothetical protein
MVDWELHGIAIRKHYKSKKFIKKLIHDWLPLGNLTSRYNKHSKANCPSCPHDDEARTHFFLCPNRKEWKTEMIHELDLYFRRTQSCPTLQDIMKEGILAWLGQTPPTLAVYPAPYDTLIHQQCSIGWNQLFLGRFSHEWKHLQDEYLARIQHRTSKGTGSTWITGIIAIIWKHVRSNWDTRNAAQHGEDSITREALLYERAIQETTEIYSEKNRVLPKDRWIFYSS